MLVAKVTSGYECNDFLRWVGAGLLANYIEAGEFTIIEVTNGWYYQAKLLLTDSQFVQLIAANIEVSLVSMVKQPELNTGNHSVLAAVQTLIGKTEELLARSANNGAEYNGRCEVHMPGNMLMSFNETVLIEDSCTDRLQDAIDKGWRVIAACPQPDQRRPDYILGRFNPTRCTDEHGSARRG